MKRRLLLEFGSTRDFNRNVEKPIVSELFKRLQKKYPKILPKNY